MANVLREPTLRTLGLGDVLDLFSAGTRPVDEGSAVERVFGTGDDRGSMVITGVNGIVGAGKAMQFASRLQPHGVALVGLDFPGVPDGLASKYPGLVAAFGKEGANAVMRGIVRMNYDGKTLPPELAGMKPRFLLEAIPEILDIKRAHYDVFRSAFPGIEIRSVTSGFPSSELGVGIAHPAFPHEVNKIFEVVEPEPSDVTRMLWALGLIPVPVSDDWSFVLDVLFCGITLAGTRYHQATNMPFWKIDKYVRKLLGPNPFRAHDAIGAKGATFLTWSCLHHLCGTYGDVFCPTEVLENHKDTGETWYPPNHFRPLVDWPLDDAGWDHLATWILGPLFQMTSVMLHEERGHLAHINAIGELCAQFRKGIIAVMREHGADAVRDTVSRYHALHPAAASEAWHPDALDVLESAEARQLYVNAEHDGTVGVVTVSRESYSWEVDRELNQALDWLKSEGIARVIVTGDFHLSTQMVGADTTAIFPALEDVDEGLRITNGWSSTARRLENEFEVSVGFVNGKRCLGGMLELMAHCHVLVAVDDARFGFPEVTLPIVPGVEGCHWTFRKSAPEHWPALLQALLTGRQVAATDAIGWLVDWAGPMDEALAKTWAVATCADHGIQRRTVEEGALEVPADAGQLPPAPSPESEEGRRAILATVQAACGTGLAEALEVQSRAAAEFIASDACMRGQIGSEYTRTMVV